MDTIDLTKVAMEAYYRISTSREIMIDSTSTTLPINMFHDGMMYALEHIEEVRNLAVAEAKEKRILNAINKLDIGWDSEWGAKELSDEANITIEEAEEALERYCI